MIIAIDGNEANVKNRVGVNQFAFEVMWSLYRFKIQDSRFKMGEARFLVFLQEKPLKDLPPETDWWKYEIFGPKKFWTWTGLVKRLYLGKPRPDVLFSPSHYGPGFSPIPYVISIMDLGFLRWPEQFTKKDFYQLKYWTWWSIKRARRIIAISKFTKNDITKTYRLDPKRVVVAYPGYKKIKSLKLKIKNYNSKLKVVKEKYEIGGNYILCLSTLKPSKNIDGLVRAYKLLITNYRLKNIDLVIAGKKGWLYEDIFGLVKKLKLQKKVIFTGFVPDEEVPVLMREARLFVMPSFWEGFGIPVLEAMDVGTPIVCSRAGALPEIVGEAAFLVDPQSPKDIAEGIKKVLLNKNLQQRLIKEGKTRVKAFSWERCGKKILTILVKEAVRN
jgi:glycosyltransferase involved in cell wall biosynthesis